MGHNCPNFNNWFFFKRAETCKICSKWVKRNSLIGQNESKLVHMDQNESNYLLFVKMGKPPWKSMKVSQMGKSVDY